MSTILYLLLYKRSRRSSVHLHLVVSVYPQILKSSKYGHFILAIWQNGYTFNTANIFWPIGDRINGVPLKKEVENA